MLDKWLLCWCDYGLNANKSKQVNMAWVHRCGSEWLIIIVWSPTPVGSGSVTDPNPKLGVWREAPGEPMFFFITKITVRQKQPVIKSNLVETISVVGSISWGRKSANGLPFRLRQLPKLGSSHNLPLMDIQGAIWTSRSKSTPWPQERFSRWRIHRSDEQTVIL